MQIPSRFDRVPIVKTEWNQEPKEDIFTRDNHQPKWIQMVYSQGHSTYHSSYNLTGRNNQLPHKKNNACHWGSSSQNIQNMVWTQHLFDTTSQIRLDDKSLLNISISPDMEACMPWDTFHIFQLLRIVFHLGSWWDGRGCTAQENSPGFNQPKGGFFHGEDLDRQRLRHWKYPRTIGFTTILPPSMKGSPFGNAVSIERLGWWCHPLPSRAGLRSPHCFFEKWGSCHPRAHLRVMQPMGIRQQKLKLSPQSSQNFYEFLSSLNNIHAIGWNGLVFGVAVPPCTHLHGHLSFSKFNTGGLKLRLEMNLDFYSKPLFQPIIFTPRVTIHTDAQRAPFTWADISSVTTHAWYPGEQISQFSVPYCIL